MYLLLSFLSTSAIIYIIAHMLPSVHIKNFKTAIGVTLVYSLLNFFLGWLLTLLTFPLIFLTLGLFKFVINAFFLWLTDKLIEGFRIEGFLWTLIMAFLISVGSSLTHLLFRF